MIAPLKRLIARMWSRHPATVRPRTRLGFEALERRDVPARYTWTNDFSTGDHDFNTSTNWYPNGVPGAGDDVRFASASHIGTNDSCDNFSGTFNSISLDMSYSGTVTLDGTVVTNNLSVYGGTIDQPLSSGASDITVYSNFEWTAGTINSTSTLSALNIDGATASIAPSNAGTVYLGSTLNFTGGSEVDVEPGEIFGSNNPLVTLFNCQMRVNTVTVGSNVRWSNVSQIELQNAADTFTLTGPGTMDKTSMYNHAGTVVIQGGATIDLIGRAVVSNTNKSSYYQDGGYLKIENGSTIKVANDVQIFGGELWTLYNPALTDNVPTQKATIDGTLYAGAGKILISTATPAQGGPHPGTLYVKSSLLLEGTVLYQPYIDGLTSGRCDRILVDGNVSLNQLQGSTATVSPVYTTTNNTVVGTWKVIERAGNGAFLGTLLGANLQYFAGPPAKSFAIGTIGNPVTSLTLNS